MSDAVELIRQRKIALILEEVELIAENEKLDCEMNIVHLNLPLLYYTFAFPKDSIYAGELGAFSLPKLLLLLSILKINFCFYSLKSSTFFVVQCTSCRKT